MMRSPIRMPITRRGLSRLARVLVYAAIALCLRPVPASAEDGPTDRGAAPAAEDTDLEARRLLEEGLKRFNAHQYPGAIERFEAAYRRSPAPGLLYNLAQAHRLNGDCGEALDFYRRYLATTPTGKNRERAQARIEEMDACARTRSSR